MKEIRALWTDHIGRTLSPPKVPQRIVSLCPSITETLFALGLGERVAGRTRFCIHPKEEVSRATRIGGTKEIRFDRLAELQPDLIIAEKEENTREMVEQLESRYPVFVMDVVDIPSAIRMIRDLGDLTGKELEAKKLEEEINSGFSQLQAVSHKVRCLYFIWRAPYMVAGTGTYIDAVLERAGYENLGRRFPGRYPVLEEGMLKQLNPDLILLSSEPYPFRSPHRAEFSCLSRGSDVRIVDGELFSWYGERMKHTPSYLRELNASLRK
jgi:ABC-type Fe3+-hydroxamate transport system substrate-binding protein